ncbi:MAG: hypothetical protein ACKO2C_04640 [Actinomycetes bacterium]
MKSLRTMILALTAVLVTAAPAGAATGVLAKAKPWHYWIAPVLFLSFLGIAALLALGYYVKVIRLKTRGR